MDTARKRGTILCVDDEASGLVVRKAIFESQGYRVFTASSGPDGLAYLASETIDLVILDYAMPGMDGHEVAQRMKRLKPDMPILMLSAFLQLPDEVLMIVDQWIMKGEPTPLLLEAVEGLLDRKR
jgi:CheY-like chemotaxis protein